MANKKSKATKKAKPNPKARLQVKGTFEQMIGAAVSVDKKRKA